jgi:hypothetical protein
MTRSFPQSLWQVIIRLRKRLGCAYWRSKAAVADGTAKAKFVRLRLEAAQIGSHANCPIGWGRGGVRGSKNWNRK